MDDMNGLFSKSFENALGSLFTSIYQINLDTGELKAFRVSEDVKGLVDHEQNADEFIKMMAEAFYHSHSQNELVNSFSVESLKKCQEEGIEKIERELVRMCKGSYHSVTLIGLLGTRPNPQPEVIIAVQDNDAEYSDRKTNSHMFQSISNVYDTMYYVDVDTDMITAIDNRMDSDIMLTNHGRFSHIMRIYGNNCIFYEDQDSFFHFMSLTHLRKNLTFDNPVLELEYRRVYDYGLEWIRGEMILVNMSQGMPSRVVYVTRNITAIKNREMAYKQAVQIVEEIDRDEVIGSNSAVQSFYKKTDFLKRLARQLQFPINAYLGLANIIELNVTDPEKVLLYTNELRRHGAEMLHITNEFNEVGEIERGQINILYEPVPAFDFFYSIVEDWREEAENKGHKFINEVSKFDKDLIMVDRRRMKESIDAIIDNAIRYTPEGGRITVTIEEMAGMSSEEIEYDIIVRDTGYGMTPTFLEHVYEPFLPVVDNRVSSEQGMGLGLGITKSMITAMRGTMDIQSQVDVGTIVSIHMKSKNARIQTEAFILNDTESTAGKEAKLALPTYTELIDKRILFYGNEGCGAILDRTKIIYDKVNWSDDIVDWFIRSRLDDYQMIIVDVTNTDKNEWNIAKEVHSLAREDASDIPIVALVDYEHFKRTHKSSFEREEIVEELEARDFCEVLFAPYDMGELLRIIGWWIK